MKSLYLPVEIYKREFIEKLFLGLIAVTRGYRVIIGEANNRVFKHSTSGVLLHKDHANWSDELLKSAKNRGMKVCAFDEEGLIIGDVSLYKSARVSTWALKNLDAIFCWGEYQKNIISKAGEGSNIYTFGSPKIDIAKLYKLKHILNYEIRNKTRILINTRFTYNNGVYGDYDVDNLIHLGIIKSTEDMENYRKIYHNDEIIFNEFCRLINMLSSISNIHITIRPHPLEWQETYEKFAAGNNKVVVDRNMDLRQQILESDFVIHDGCTTAIEASAMGKFVLGLRPSGLNPSYDDFANKFSLNFTSAEKICEFIKNSENKSFVNHKSIDAKYYIQNWCGEYYSCDKIMDVIDTISGGIISTRQNEIPCAFNYKISIYNFLKKYQLAQGIMTLVAPKAFRKFMNNSKITSSKFPGLVIEELKDLIKWFSSVNPNLLDENKINIRVSGNQVFILEPKRVAND
jgi:surface carbohydrate biosynthesis protein